MTVILLRTVIFYVFLTAMMRLMGKRQIGELQLPEFVAAMMISQIASLPIADRDIPLVHGALPIVILGSLEVCTAYVFKKLPFLRKYVYGEPIVLMEDGKICEKGLEKARISAEEVLAAIRGAGHGSASEVDCMILEQSGQISVIARKGDSPLTMRGAGRQTDESGAMLPVMTEGTVNTNFAILRGMDRKKITRELKKLGVKAEECLYLTIDRGGNACAARRGENER